ncbi:protein translocase subunit SecDF [Chryseotalea sanaruensis]|uniref:Multifunctional fusion protein n=1 Tax=Chryseotalea sanaruensis TaxID=2482724 RepID=A0A401UAW4_9BACT|nr:protein translocase subunit SecDF [Chryseotalea sanaruensis]GCC52025.1 protein translocase subunit SecDF [Chryseotalea sanaruensis]
MQNKGFVITLTVVITALCLFYLSFTYVSRGVQQDAVAYATDATGIVNLNKKQGYIDSVWNKPVYNVFGYEYTYKDVKDNELHMGLDLQGGMHVTLEVSPIDIIRGLAGNTTDSAFVKAINAARVAQRNSQESFGDLFFDAYRDANPGKKLSSVFANASTRGRINISDDDAQVMKVVNDEIESAIDRSYTILKNRLDQFGTSSPNIQRLPGTGRIQVEIPGADNPQRIRKLLQGVARLEFWDVVETSTLSSSFIAINDLLVNEQKAKAAAQAPVSTSTPEVGSDLESQLAADSTKSGLDSLQNLNISPIYSLSVPMGSFRYDIKDTAEINAIFKRQDIKNMFPRNVGLFWAAKPDKDQQGNEAMELHFLDLGRNGKSRLTGEVINDARYELDPLKGAAVSMTMNAAGTRMWSKMTADAAAKSPKGRIAIVLDNVVYSAPYVNDEIPNGNSQISGSFTTDEAKDLANILKAGSLPAPTRIVEEAIVGPTLGQVAQSQGFISILSGFALVVVFMVMYYAKGGLIANLALLFNVFFILGILAQPTLGTALTLPGIAGILLTVGMAVDANVLIFERIKEEMAAGLKLRAAVKKGYEKAFSTILDSNLTTLITAFFLFILGTGPIKGFAITLIIGIICSFFTAVYISRIVVEWMIANKGDDSNISFDTVIARAIKKRKHFNFVKYSKPAYLVSSVIILIGFVLIFIQGLNLGVDFKGGRSYVVSFSKPVVATDMKLALSESFENSGTEVKNYGGNNVVKVTTSWLIDDESDQTDEKVKNALVSGLAKFTGLEFAENESALDDTHFTISSSTKVGATVADDIKNSAWKASLFSLVGIFLYILIRFRKWQYSAGAIIATLHDALFVFAAFGIARAFGISFEIDQVFVAAILTIIGYSINDTVIIFDRIREYIGLGTSHDKAKIVNDALNDTLARTIITAGTTLLTVVALLLFGGEVLRGFAFALLVGVAVGTYSSVFIAGPTVLDLDKEDSADKQTDVKKTKPATV